MRTAVRQFARQLVPALVALASFTLLLGIIYPLATTAVSQVAFGGRADGSVVERDGVAVGSELIGQPFLSPQYFHSRPSAAGAGYDASASGGSNLGPLNADLLGTVVERVAEYRAVNGLDARVPVPVDAVTASASGLDPHISIANARLQARRVAGARGVAEGDVLAEVDAAIDQPALGVLGEPAVDVLALNLALDARFGAVD